MTRIFLNKYGKAISDYNVVDYLNDNIGKTIHVSTNNILLPLMYLIVSGDISNKNVLLNIDGQEFEINKYGNIKTGKSDSYILNWDSELRLDILKKQVEIKKGENN